MITIRVAMPFSHPVLRFILVFCTGYAGIIYFSRRFFHGDITSQTTWDHMGYALGPILILSYLLALKRNESLWKYIGQIGGWVGFLLLMVLLYSFRAEIGQLKSRVVAALMPDQGFNQTPGTLSFFRSSNGHFHVEAIVNGHPVRFLVDTGASDIVIAPHVAKTLGFPRNRLNFSIPYSTANGQGRGAPVVLDSFQVGEFTLNNLPASINQASMQNSLLGMRFFNKLQGFEIQKERLTIHWTTSQSSP